MISSNINLWHGDAAVLRAWYEGYGLTLERRTAQLEFAVMVRSMLHYADEFGEVLQQILGASACQRWEDVATCFWHMTDSLA